MKNISIKTALLFFIFTFSFFIPSAHAQWQQSNGPTGGRVQTLAGSGSTIYAGGPTAGVFRSTDDGLTWRPANKGLENATINSIVIVNGSIYAATYTGLYKSTDDGATWFTTDSGMHNVQIDAIVEKGSSLFVGTNGGG